VLLVCFFFVPVLPLSCSDVVAINSAGASGTAKQEAVRGTERKGKLLFWIER